MRSIICLLLLMSSIGVWGQPGARVPGEFLVQISSETSPEAILAELRKRSPENSVRYKREVAAALGIHLLQVDESLLSGARALTLFRQIPGVRLAQYNHQLELRKAPMAMPDDPLFGDQWGLENTGQGGGTPDADIDATDAWDRTTGGVTAIGDTIVVAVIDDGFDLMHNDLDWWRNNQEIPNNGIDDDDNGYVDDVYGWNAFGSNGNIPTATHGTHVAGVIGAIGNNDQGISGVNWQVKLMAVAGASGTEDVVVEAYGYILAQRQLYDATQGLEGAYVVATNASFGVNNGDPINYPIWCAMYDTLGAAGILNVAATMNINADVEVAGDMPSRCTSDYLIAVTSTTALDTRDQGAAFGNISIDLGAPGTGIYGTLPGNVYGFRTGTSFATPFVTGTIALMYADACPALMLSTRDAPHLLAQRIRQDILNSVDPLPTLDGLTVTGGRLNAFQSLLSLADTCAQIPGSCLPPYNFRSAANTDTTAWLNWTALDSINGFRVRYRLHTATVWVDSVMTLTPPLVLDSLIGCTDYVYQVGRICADSSVQYGPPQFFQTEGCCQPPVNIQLLEAREDSLLISWEGVFGSTEYAARYRMVGTTSWTTLFGLSDTLLTLRSLLPCTAYQFQVRALCDTTDLGFGATAVFTTKGCGICLDIEYCDAQGTDISFEWIESVELGPLSRISGKNDGYIAFTDPTIILPVDTPLPLILTPGYAGAPFDEAWRIWIDTSRNGAFEPGELFYDSGPQNGVIQDLLTIPAVSTGEPTRMRIAMRFAGFTGTDRPEACGTFAGGEVEDYCIFLAPADTLLCPAPSTAILDFTPIGDSLRLRWLTPIRSDSMEVRLTPINEGSAQTVFTDTTVVTWGNLPPCTDYWVDIRSRCGILAGPWRRMQRVATKGCGDCRDLPYCNSSGRSDSLWISQFLFASLVHNSSADGGYADVTYLEDSLLVGETYHFSLDAGFSGADRLVYWNVWADVNRDGNFGFNESVFATEALSSERISDSLQVAENLPVGSVRLRVSLRDGQDAGACELFESGEVEDFCFFINNLTDIPKLPETAIRIFPIPADEKLHVESSLVLTGYRLYDVQGQQVQRASFTRTKATSLSVRTLPAGLYILELNTPQGPQRRQVWIR